LACVIGAAEDEPSDDEATGVESADDESAGFAMTVSAELIEAAGATIGGSGVSF
jgi:hypothetical protein